MLNEFLYVYPLKQEQQSGNRVLCLRKRQRLRFSGDCDPSQWRVYHS